MAPVRHVVNSCLKAVSKSELRIQRPTRGYEWLTIWLQGASGDSKANLLQYRDVLMQEFDGDPCQIRLLWLSGQVGYLNCVDVALWEVLRTNSGKVVPLGHKLLLVKAIQLLPKGTGPTRRQQEFSGGMDDEATAI